LEKFVRRLNRKADYLINNACLSRRGLLSECSWEDFEYVQRVGVTAPYYLTLLLARRGLFAPQTAVVNIASTRAAQSQADTESYSAAKGGIAALTHALSVSLAGLDCYRCLSRKKERRSYRERYEPACAGSAVRKI
jgi:short-subunit dehydrogenase